MPKSQQIPALAREGYTGGYHAFKKILRIEEDGSKIISRDHTGWQHFKSDYISSAWLNPDATRVPYCIPLDIDVKDTDKKWLDNEGRINWEKAVAFLQKNYPEIFGYLLFVVRSTAGKGIHLGIAISPIVKDGSEGSIKTAFLAQQAQEALIRLLRHHGLGADNAARGLVREVPNFRRHEVSKYSQAKQLSYNKDIHALIKREGRNVITEILAITNKLKECRPKAKKDQEEILHPHKTTEARLAHLYVDLFDNLGQSKCYTMAELIKLTQISRATLRNILVSRPKSRPKWLNVNYLNKSEGYELWINPEFGDIERAVKLIENPEYASTFLKDLKLPEEVEDGGRNAWLSSAAIYYKWYGYSKNQTLIALNYHAKQIPGYKESRNCKSLTRIVGSVYRNQPQMFGIKSGQELPLVLREKSKVKNNIEGPYTTGPLASGNTHYSLAFTRRGGEKWLSIYSPDGNSIVASSVVKGSGYKLQLAAIQEVLTTLEEKPRVLIVKGQSMLQDNPVVDKFANYYGFGFEFAERSAEDKRIIKEFREALDSTNSSSLNSKPNLSKLVEASLKNHNWSLILEREFWKLSGVNISTPNRQIKISCNGSATSQSKLVNPSSSLKLFQKMEFFNFPDLSEKKVRCDGYVAYLDNYYWLGESWIKRKLQVLDDGESVEFYEKGQLICVYEKLKGKNLKTGGSHQPWARAKFRNSSYRKKALSVGPNFDRLVVHQIAKGDGIIHTNKIFAFLSLMGSWPYEQLEAVASYCVKRGNFTNRFFKSCLEAGVE